MERVASFSHQRQLIAQAMSVQTKVATAQVEVASGQKATDYKGVASNTRLLVTLEGELERAERYIDNGNVVSARVETSYDAVSQIVNIATDARVWLSEGLSSTGNVATFNQQAQSSLEEIASLLNTQQDGRYLFGGDQTDQPPIDLSAYPPATTPSTADVSYYQGDGEIASYQASPDLTIDYGVTADSDGFEKLMRAMNLAANANSDPVDTAALEEAYDLTTEALDDLLVEQTNLSLAADKVERAIDTNLDYQLYSQALIEDLKNVDIAEASAKLSSYEAQLEASYSVLNILNRMSLVDYL